MEKKNLNVKIASEVYNLLKSDIGKGKISDFVEQLIVREIGSAEKKVEQEYRDCYANPRMLKEAKQWESASLESRARFSKKKVK